MHITTLVYIAFMSQAPAAIPTASLPGCSTDIEALFEAGNFPAAAQTAEDCFTRTPHPRLLYFAGQGHQNSGRIGTALHAYLEFLRDGSDEPRLLNDARERVDQLRPSTTAIVFSVHYNGNAPGEEPEIRLEHSDKGYPPLIVNLQHCEGSLGARTLHLERGLWQVRIAAPGFITENRHLRVNALTETLTVNVELEPEPPTTVQPPPENSADVDLGPAARPRLRLAETITYGALGLSLGIAGSALAGVSSRRGLEQLSEQVVVDRDIQSYSVAAGLLGGSLGTGLGAVTRHFARSSTPFLAEFGAGAAATVAGWAIFAVTSGHLRARDGLNPDPGWNRGGRIAASGLAGLGMALLVTSVTSWVSDRLQKRRSTRTLRRALRAPVLQLTPILAL